jgi:hypothetical protein
MFHFRESKMQATRLVVEHHHLADHLSKQMFKTYHSPKAHGLYPERKVQYYRLHSLKLGHCLNINDMKLYRASHPAPVPVLASLQRGCVVSLHYDRIIRRNVRQV